MRRTFLKLAHRPSLVLLVIALFVVAVLAVHPVAVHAVSSSVKDAKQGVGLTGSGSDGISISSVIKAVINIISAIVGAVAVIMIVIGGMKYVTSGGDANNVAGAKNTILYAIVGLVVVALAQVIVHFVINAAS